MVYTFLLIVSQTCTAIALIKICKQDGPLSTFLLKQTDVFQLDETRVPLQMEPFWCTFLLLSNVSFHAQHIVHMAVWISVTQVIRLVELKVYRKFDVTLVFMYPAPSERADNKGQTIFAV